MLFRVFEHYDHNQDICYCIDQENKNNKPEECFICYENQTESKLNTISLRSELNYIKDCTCNGWIHKKCLDIWYKKNKKCPICRIEIAENLPIVINVINYKQTTLRIYGFGVKFLYNVLINAINILLIYTLIEILMSLQLIKNENKENN